MPEFRKQFEDRLPAIEQAIASMPGSLENYIPGMTKDRLRRFFQRFSVLLGKIDKRGAKHPQYLAWQGQPAPQYLIALVDAAISHMSSGAATFAQNTLPQLTSVQEALVKAVGSDPAEIRTLSSSVAADLGSAVEQSDELLRHAVQSFEALREAASRSEAHISRINELAERAKAGAEKADQARRAVEALVTPDGRNRSSLETLARRARERITEIDELADKAKGEFSAASDAATGAEDNLKRTEESLTALRTLQREAEQILNLSSQAGLAASYKAESGILQKRAWIFTAVLYGTALLTLGIAAFWVLPGLEVALKARAEGIGFWEGLTLTLLRASVLAPLIYILYFTTKRVSALETLRMDYAEKAAASLAYSGYREQMTNDGDLLKQLKGSLLIKFAEHPERLLRPGSTSTSAKIKTGGFEAETNVNARHQTGYDGPTSADEGT